MQALRLTLSLTLRQSLWCQMARVRLILGRFIPTHRGDVMRFLPVIASVLLLSGCAFGPDPYKGTDYSSSAYNHMNLRNVLIDTEFQSTGMAPNIEHEMTPAPADVLREAIAKHYRAEPGNSARAKLHFVIKDASVTVTDLIPQERSWFEEQFSQDMEYRLEGHLVVETASEGMSQRRGYVQAEANRTIETPYINNYALKVQAQSLVRQMVDDVIAELDKQIEDNMGGFIISQPEQVYFPQRSGRWDHVMNEPVRTAGLE